MGQHEIEHAIVVSVETIDRADLPPKRIRDILWNLYQIQSRFDAYATSRVRDILRRRRYLLPPNDVVLGSPEWHADAAKSGIDAEAPEQISVQVVGLEVMAAAERVPDRSVIACWYSLFPWFAEAMGVDLCALTIDPAVSSMLTIVERTRAFEERSDWGLLKPPRREDLPGLSEAMRTFAPVWFALEWALPPQRDRVEVVFEVCAALRRSLERGTSPADALTEALEALAEFNEWSSLLSLFQRGFGYDLGERGPRTGGAFTDRIKRVIDFSGPHPRVNAVAANAELALQSPKER
jgi:hypothetical protein